MRSQGQVLYPRDAGNPEHEPARRRLSLLTLGSRHCPGPCRPRGTLLPPALSLQQAHSLPLQRWLVSHACPGLTRDAMRPEAPRALTPARSPGKVPTRASPGATGGNGYFTWASVFAPARTSPSRPASGPLCSDLSPRS